LVKPNEDRLIDWQRQNGGAENAGVDNATTSTYITVIMSLFGLHKYNGGIQR